MHQNYPRYSCVHCVWCCLVWVTRKGDATGGGMSRVGILARSLPELAGVRGWVGFISNSRYHLHHQPPHCQISSQIVKTWASRALTASDLWPSAFYHFVRADTRLRVLYLHLQKKNIWEASIFAASRSWAEPRAGETMKIVFWFNLALHGIQLGRNKAHLLMFSQLYFSFHFNPTYFK